MAGKRRPFRDAGLLVAIAVGVCLFYLPNWFTRICFILFLIAVWVGLVKRTICDVKNKSSPGYCGNDARGVLRACHLKEHKRRKRRIILGWFGIRSRGKRQSRWKDAAYTPGEHLILQQGPPPIRVSVERDGFDKLTLVVSLASLVGTFLPLFFK